MGAEPRWLSPTELRAWLTYRAGMTLLEAALDRQLQRDSGMPLAYYQILAILSEAPERTLRMSFLADKLQSSPSRLSHAVGKLESHGWVRRFPAPDDRRSILAQLTDDGFEVLKAAAPGHVETVRRLVFDQLTPEQVDQLGTIFGAIRAAVRGPDDNGCGGSPGITC